MRKITKQMAILMVVKFAGNFGSAMLSFAIGLYVLKRTGSALGMGFTMITGPLLSLVLTPVVGYVVDTWHHRPIMVAAQVTTSLGLLGFFFAFRAAPQAYFPEVIGLLIVLQITDNFLSTALSASLVQLFADVQLQAVNSYNQSIQSLASFLAPIIGAVVYTLVSIGSFALIEIGFELVALVGILAFKFHPAPAREATHESVGQNFKAGFAYLRQQKLIFLLGLTAALINFFFAAVNVGEPFVLVHALRLSNSQYGITESAFAVGMFVGGIVLSQIHLRSHPVMVSYRFIILLSVTLMLVGVPVLTPWGNGVNTWFYFFMNAATGFCLVFTNTPMSVFMQQTIPQHMQGRVFSLFSTMATLLMPLGTLLYGVLFDHLAAPAIYVVTGLLLIAFTVAVLLGLRRFGLVPAQIDTP